MIIYRKTGLFVQEKETETVTGIVNSAIISASLGGRRIRGLEDKVKLVFKPFQVVLITKISKLVLGMVFFVLSRILTNCYAIFIWCYRYCRSEVLNFLPLQPLPSFPKDCKAHIPWCNLQLLQLRHCLYCCLYCLYFALFIYIVLMFSYKVVFAYCTLRTMNLCLLHI